MGAGAGTGGVKEAGPKRPLQRWVLRGPITGTAPAVGAEGCDCPCFEPRAGFFGKGLLLGGSGAPRGTGTFINAQAPEKCPWCSRPFRPPLLATHFPTSQGLLAAPLPGSEPKAGHCRPWHRMLRHSPAFWLCLWAVAAASV